MKRLSAQDVHAHKVSELGLDPTALDLTSLEAVAAALRRAASFFCPCAASTLVRAVVNPLNGLVQDLVELRESVENTLEAVIAHGDLLEQRDIANGDAGARSGLLLYAAPPSFVHRESGSVLLLGIASDQQSPLPDEFVARIEHINHVRILRSATGEDLRAELTHLGLSELSFDGWLKPPTVETAAQHVSRFDRLLQDAPSSSDIPNLTLLDASRSVRYYRGRWVEPRSQTGRFLGRRGQAYGADLWCYVELSNGRPQRFVDLPLDNNRARGCDEAWWLQMAIDAKRGEPQRFRIRRGPGGNCLFELFSPLPMWARRRWDAVGEPTPGSGCLFAYRFPEREIAEELRFIHDRLWLAQLIQGTEGR